MDVIEYRGYLDKMLERIASYSAPLPLRYVIHTPVLIEHWFEWAERQKPPEKQSEEIRPFGDVEGPDWMQSEFDGFEQFYEYYRDLCGEGTEDAS